MRHRRLLAAACAALAAGLAASLAACSSSGTPARAASLITVSSNQCGGTWSVSGPGWHTLQISNQGTTGAEIDLVDPASGAVDAEIETTGPGTVNPITIDFGSGRYALECSFQDFNPLRGPV